MLRVSIFLWVTIATILTIHAQTPTVQDCLGAIPVCQGQYEQGQSFSGTGNIANEINSGPSCLNTGEKNDVWYVITVQSSGILSFTITPNNSGDDYDWALFDLTNHLCADIYNNSALEVRCNFSGTSGSTGANGQSGSQNSPTLPVLANQVYVLNISNYSSTQYGYLLSFTASTAGIYDNQKPTMQQILPMNCFATSFTLRFSEFILCSTLSVTDFQLTGPTGTVTINSITANGCQGGGNHDRDYTFNTGGILPDGAYQLHLTGEVKDLCNNASIPAVLNFTVADNQPAPMAVTANNPCVGINLQFNSTFYPSATYVWSGPAGFTSSTYAPVILNTTLANSGTYSVTATLANGCLRTGSIIVTVHPSPSGSPIIYHY